MNTPPVVLELGGHPAAAAAGTHLVDLGWIVVRWAPLPDQSGPMGKRVETVDPRSITRLLPTLVDAVIDGVPADTWARWGIDPDAQANRLAVPWVSAPDPSATPPGQLGAVAALHLAAALAQQRPGRIVVHPAPAPTP